jgi:hypothetical protein
LKEECTAEREKRRERFPRFPAFEDWQRQRLGREAADAWRFTPKTSATLGLITGEGAELGRAHDIRDFMAAVKGREVHYHRLGQPDQKSFVDRGRVILIHDLERDSVRAALQLSAQKWKSLHVSGSETYLRQCVELAAEHGFRISNPELAPAIEAERERRSRERQLHRDRHPDSIPQPRPIRDVAEAYDRHLAEVNRSARGPRDISRVDAEVAVRLNLTGHSRVEIERAVRERAPPTDPASSGTGRPTPVVPPTTPSGRRAPRSCSASSPCARTCSGSKAGEDASSSSASTCLSGAAWVSDGDPPVNRLGWLSRQQSFRTGR